MPCLRRPSGPGRNGVICAPYSGAGGESTRTVVLAARTRSGDPSVAVWLGRPLRRRTDAAPDGAAPARPLAHHVLRAAARFLFLPVGVAAGRPDVRAELGLVFADDAILVAARQDRVDDFLLVEELDLVVLFHVFDAAGRREQGVH